MKEYTREELENMTEAELKVLLAELQAEENEDEEEERETKRRQRRKRNARGASEVQSGTKARSERLETGKRPNHFLKSEVADSFKEDSEVDKLLWKGRKPQKRGDRVADTIELECYICGEPIIVSGSCMVPEGRIKCNDCTK